MDILEATRSYEQWMRDCTIVVESDLRMKHAQMRQDPFLFFRGTFYRWAELWPEICREACKAPSALAIGDLHVGSFGTWRDGEGRLCWGVDDFDESFELPYTNDLARLAASLRMVIDSNDLTINMKDGCKAILEGYEKALKEGGLPIVLAENETRLRKLGTDCFKSPKDFWGKLQDLSTVKKGLPQDAKKTLLQTLPDARVEYRVVRRRAGLGSLGQERFVAIANWNGGYIAREVKAMLPSACVWLKCHKGRTQSYYQRAIQSAVRSHDPFQRIQGRWLVRRLSPDSNPIEISDLSKMRDEEILLQAMGTEAANVHLGTRRNIKAILKDLHGRKPNWLRKAGEAMAREMEREWKAYKKPNARKALD